MLCVLVQHVCRRLLLNRKVGVSDAVFALMEAHLHLHKQEKSAFSNGLLLNERWMINGQLLVQQFKVCSTHAHLWVHAAMHCREHVFL